MLKKKCKKKDTIFVQSGIMLKRFRITLNGHASISSLVPYPLFESKLKCKENISGT